MTTGKFLIDMFNAVETEFLNKASGSEMEQILVMVSGVDKKELETAEGVSAIRVIDQLNGILLFPFQKEPEINLTGLKIDRNPTRKIWT